MDVVKKWTKGRERVEVVYDPFVYDPDEVLSAGVRIAHKAGARVVLGTDPVDDLDEWEEEMQKTHHLFPVYAYVHGGVALAMAPFHNPWDSGRSGTIAIPKDWGDEAKARQAARAALATFASWLNGEVFCIRKLRRTCDDAEKYNCDCDACWVADDDEPLLGGVIGLDGVEGLVREEFGVDDTWDEEGT